MAVDYVGNILKIGDRVAIAPKSKYTDPKIVIVSGFTRSDINIKYNAYWDRFFGEWKPTQRWSYRNNRYENGEKTSTTGYIFKLNNEDTI